MPASDVQSVNEIYMRAELKGLHSPDVDLTSFAPVDPLSFRFLLQAMIGTEGTDGAESFDFDVCTPGWLISQHSQGNYPGAIFGRHMLIVFSYDLNAIKGATAHYCRRCIANDWEALAEKLARIGHWEFEDFQEYRAKE
jgi:hypothetical protein